MDIFAKPDRTEMLGSLSGYNKRFISSVVADEMWVKLVKCFWCFEGYDIMCTLSITIPDELEVFLRKRGGDYDVSFYDLGR